MKPLAVMLGALALLSCSDEARYRPGEAEVRLYAEARCAAKLQCCGSAASPDCAASLTDSVVNAEAILDTEIEFSESCMNELLDYAERIQCDAGAEGSPSCRLGVGQGTYGDECEFIDDNLGFYITKCREGLTCHAGRCVDELLDGTQPANEGEICSDFVGCRSEYYCNTESRCEERLPTGESCTAAGQCEAGSYCHGYLADAGTCVVQATAGDPCDEQYDRSCGYVTLEDHSTSLTFCIDGICRLPGSPLCE